MLIDKYLRDFDFREYHEIKLDRVNTHAYDAMLSADISRSFTIRTLFRLRGIRSHIARVQDMTKFGFIMLEEKPGEEVILGLISTSPTFSECRLQFSPEKFRIDRHPRHIKAVINFVIRHEEHQSFISTETRVLCGSAYLKRRFSIYWFFVEPFSRLIRKKMLAQIKKQVGQQTIAQEVL